MNKNKIISMKETIKKYEKLEDNYSTLIDFLTMPEYVEKKYYGQEGLWIDCMITYGNGSDKKKVIINQSSETFKKILDLLQEESKHVYEEMENL